MQLLEVLELVLDALLVLRGGEGGHDVCSSASSSLPSRSQSTASFWMGKETQPVFDAAAVTALKLMTGATGLAQVDGNWPSAALAAGTDALLTGTDGGGAAGGGSEHKSSLRVVVCTGVQGTSGPGTVRRMEGWQSGSQCFGTPASRGGGGKRVAEGTNKPREGMGAASSSQQAGCGACAMRMWLIRISRAELGPPCAASVTKIGTGDAHANF